ncbi:hypothetical protein [Dokdonella sp.]|uniref:hypothetical protein n=1 Tax=Dokdonella sp. TaxID=2291710 RepID=UPI0031C7DFFE|nr:hypothetical protein [Dokdonella sp.]
MQAGEEARPDAQDAAASAAVDSLVAARGAVVQAAQVATAAWGVLRAELRLAQASGSRVVVLGLVMLVLAASAWLAILATIAAGIYELTGSVFIGMGVVALANVLALVWIARVVKACARDLGLPQTRAVLRELANREP